MNKEVVELAVTEMIRKAKNESHSKDALQWAQAAVNAANAYYTLKAAENHRPIDPID